MIQIPPRLRDALGRAPSVVVAPVGVGAGQEALAEWARAEGRRLVTDPKEVSSEPTLLVSPRRSLLATLPTWLPLDEVLALEEDDVTFDPESWRGLLNEFTNGFADSTFEQTEGWPAGLEIALRVGPTHTPLHLHPLATVALERLLQAACDREALVRASVTPLLTPALHDPLGLRGEVVDELFDVGYFRPVRGGLAIPRLLRSYLRPRTGPNEATGVARLLADDRHLDAALVVLREAGQWEAYLELLALGFEASSSGGEASLRRALRDVPPALRREPAYLYLLGSLERLRGELQRSQDHYRVARKGAPRPIRARIDNARGIAFAMQGELERARRAFGAATRGSGSARLEGEARHNRAGVHIRQGRFDAAEKDLRQAVAKFRESGDYVHEARSLQLLALSRHQRGMLMEARSGYEEALELLATLGQSTALLRVNLAEVLLLTGHPAEAKAQLEQAAADAQGDTRARGYVEVNLALLLISQGGAEAAAHKLEAFIRRGEVESHLTAEARLLLARALRLQGRSDEALTHARAAESVGVAAELEEALCARTDLGPVIERSRSEEARFELATALIHRGEPGDLEEALDLIRRHSYRILLDTPEHASALAAMSKEDPSLVELFPLRIGSFGGFRLRFLGRTFGLAEFPTRKSAALLMRLAIESRPLSRETLAEEFWGDAGNPLQSLQTGLYHLNRTLGAQVVAGRKGNVELAYPVILDLAAFEEAANETLESSWTQGADGIRRVLTLAEGEPLAEFPEWFDDERRHADGLVVRLLRRLAELEAPNPQRAAEALEQLVRLDPYDIESRRSLIDIYSLLGQPDQARSQAERLRELEKEL